LAVWEGEGGEGGKGGALTGYVDDVLRVGGSAGAVMLLRVYPFVVTAPAAARGTPGVGVVGNPFSSFLKTGGERCEEAAASMAAIAVAAWVAESLLSPKPAGMLTTAGTGFKALLCAEPDTLCGEVGFGCLSNRFIRSGSGEYMPATASAGACTAQVLVAEIPPK
jgi:hypothetical protein